MTLLILPNVFNAQSFKISADKTTVGEYESFQVYFEFSGGDINKVRDFHPPNFQGFRVLGGPNQSSSMQTINGQTSGSVSYSYILRPEKTGSFTIAPASVIYQGKRFTSKPLKIKVVKGRAPQQKRGSAQSGGLTDAEIAKNVFLKTIPSKLRVMQGEQITVSFKLYTKLNISSPSISKLPTYQGFWAEDLEMPRNISFKIEMYNGERFRVAEIKKVALFPTKSGKLEISSFELNVPVLIRKQRKSRSMFDDFFNDPFFGRTETYKFLTVSKPVKIKVDPLPTANVPASFKGAVGEFSMKGYLDKNKVKINEPVSLKLKLSGKGNIKLVDMPEVTLPPGFEQYDPKLSDNISNAAVISGTKSVEYLIVPRIPGKKVIPPFKFSFYSLKDRKYKTLTAGPFELNVEGSADIAGIPSTSNFSKEDVRLLSEDIRFIKTDLNLIRISNVNSLPSWFFFLLIIPAGLFGVLVLWKRKTDKLRGNVRLMRSQKAEKAAKKRLKAARKALDEKNSHLFYEEIAKGLQGYLEDKLYIQTSEFTIDRAVAELTALGIDAELTAKIRDVFEKCEFARFAPSGSESAEAELYKFTLGAIADLENSVKRVKK
jgi:hypothetical protein